MVNGDRKSELVIQNKASILREKDILQPDDVSTPLKRVYFPIQMMYLENAAGGESLDAWHSEFAGRNVRVHGRDRQSRRAGPMRLDQPGRDRGAVLPALMTCRKLFDYERERLAYVPEGLSAGG